MADRETPDPILMKDAELFGHPVELDASSAARRLALLGTRLALPVSPLPGEGLPDLYLRAVTRNGEKFASRLWSRLAGVQKGYFGHRNFIDLDISDSAFSDFLGTPNGGSDIAPLRYNRERAGTVTFFGTVLRVGSFSARRRVSPRFLADFGYQKAIWAVASLDFDPINKERLLGHCPCCREKLTFQRVRGLFFCPFCGGDGRDKVDFRDYPQPLVELETFENIELACALIDPVHENRRDGDFHPDLRALKRGQLFEFIILLAALIDKLKDPSEDTPVSAYALDKAAEAMRRYPTGLLEIGELVDGVRRKASYKQGRTFQHPISLEVFFLKGYFGSEFAKVIKNQLRSGLKTTNENSLLSATSGSKFRRPHPRTKRAGGFDANNRKHKFEFAMLLARENRELRVEARNAGLPLIELMSLYDSGLIGCPDDQLSDYLNDPRQGQSFASRLGSLSVPATARQWLLADAVFALAGGKVVWQHILSLVFQGKLPVSLVEGQGPLIKRTFVTDLGKVAEACNVLQYHDLRESVILPNADAGFYLSVADAQVATLVTNGLLPSGGIDLAAIMAFQRSYVNPSEILRFLRVKEHYTRSTALIFTQILSAGIEPLHKNPSTRDRAAVHKYFRDLGYL